MGGLLSGGLIGLSIATPVGPIALLNISRTLARGPLAGIVTGLGAATVHAVYGSIAALSAGFLVTFQQVHSGAFRAAGALLLCCMALSLFGRAVRRLPPQSPTRGLFGDYVSALGLSITNPITLSGFMVGMAAFGTSAGNCGEVIAGVVIASFSWYALLALAAGTFRRKLTDSWMRRVNQVAALSTFGMGVLAFAEAFG